MTLATLPPLKYGYDQLEPHISKAIMELHHTKHHQAYVNGLNAAEQSYAAASTHKEKIALQAAIKFNGGGGVGGVLEAGPLLDAINRDFGSVDAFKKEFEDSTLGIQGSGWGWLVFDKKIGRLEITTTPNQDPVTGKDKVPIIGVDIWEHAFYLQYQNNKGSYLKAIWNVINFKEAEKRLTAVLPAGKGHPYL